jgi:hypothetical protein
VGARSLHVEERRVEPAEPILTHRLIFADPWSPSIGKRELKLVLRRGGLGIGRLPLEGGNPDAE